MIDAGCEVDLRGLERVVGRKVDSKEEDTAGVWAITLQDVCQLQNNRTHRVRA